MTDGLEQKIDKLTVMPGKLVMNDDGQNRQFKLQVYQSNRGRGQIICKYKQRGFQDRFRSDSSRRNTFREGQGMDKSIEVGQGMTWIIWEITETIWAVIKDMEDKIIMKMDSGRNIRNQGYERGMDITNDR